MFSYLKTWSCVQDHLFYGTVRDHFRKRWADRKDVPLFFLRCYTWHVWKHVSAIFFRSTADKAAWDVFTISLWDTVMAISARAHVRWLTWWLQPGNNSGKDGVCSGKTQWGKKHYCFWWFIRFKYMSALTQWGPLPIVPNTAKTISMGRAGHFATGRIKV